MKTLGFFENNIKPSNPDRLDGFVFESTDVAVFS